MNKVQIISNASLRMGAGRITNIGVGASVQAQTMLELYDGYYYGELAGKYVWNFALRLQNLNQVIAPPIFNLQYAYQIPPDCLRILTVQPSGVFFKQIGGLLYTTLNGPIVLVYVGRIQEGNLPEYYVNYWQTRLAAICCMAVTQKEELGNSLMAEAKQLRLEAMRVDVANSPPFPISGGLIVGSKFNNFPIGI